MSLSLFHSVYLAIWLLLCLAAVGLMVAKRHELTLFGASYRRLLLQPWKLILFAIAWVGIVTIAPYTGDPTWDWVDASFMAIFAFTTAPWSVGVLFRAIRGMKREPAEIYIAVIVWLFSASWSYDGYLLLRDGVYPITWHINLAASSTLYIMAGLLWSLEDVPERGLVYAFMLERWPHELGEGRSLKLAAAAAIVAIPVALLFIYMLLHGLMGW